MKNTKEMEFRLANWNDCKIIWKWRNDEITRKMSFNVKFISLKEHESWFKKALKNKSKKILMIEKNNKPIGVVRFDIKNGTAEVNINIALENRGKGIGRVAIKNACNYAFKYLNISKIVARIKKENVPSLKAFSQAGFEIQKEEKNIVSMIKKCG